MKLSIKYPPGYVLATCMSSFGGFLNGYDTGSIGAVTEMSHFSKTFGTLTPFMRGFTVSLIMLTGAFPCLFAGQLADRLGRLSVMSIGALIFVLGAVMQGSASQLPVLLTGRAFAGFGQGVWLSCMFVYITEIAPSSRRGTLASMPQLFGCTGICVGYFTCYGSVMIDSDLSWRTPYIIQAIVGATFATTKLILPESPRWLLLQGHREKAIQELKRLDFSAVEAEKDLLGPAAEQRIAVRQAGAIEGLKMIFQKPYRRSTFLALYVLGVIQLSGIDGVLYYAPTLFAQAGLPASSASFLASGLSAILMLAISIPALLLADKIPRRTSIIAGGLVLTTCMLVIGSLYASHAVDPTGVVRWIVIILVFVFGLCYASTWGLVGKIYASEIQPAATRSAASCVAQGLGFFTNWLVAIITPVLLANSSFGAYFLFGGVCLVSVFVLAATMPETRGQSLEAIQEAFQTPANTSGRLASLIRKWAGRRGVVSSSRSGSETSVGAVELTEGVGATGTDVSSTDGAQVEATAQQI